MRKSIVSLIFLLLFVIGLLSYISYRNSLQQLSIKLEPGVNGRLYSEWSAENQQGKLVANVAGSYTTKLKKRTYVLVTKNNLGLQDRTVDVSVGDSPVREDIKLDFTPNKLEQILPNELPTITAVFKAAYPSTSGGYGLSGELFGRADWFGGKLTPIDQNQDVMRLVLHKVGNSWQVVTSPPAIILSTVVYPNVPKDILVQTNDL